MRTTAFALLLSIGLAGCGGRAQPPAPAPSAFDPDSIPDAYARPTAALMWPGATRAFQVTPSGDLCNGDWIVRLSAAAAGEAAAAPLRIAFEDRWLPVAHWRRHDGPVLWDFEAVALPAGAAVDLRHGAAVSPATAGDVGGERRSARARTAPDSGLVVSLVVRATNEGGTATDARLDASLVASDSTVAFVAFDAPEKPDAYAWMGKGGSAEALVHGWTDLPVSAADARATWSLAPGDTRTARFILPAYGTKPRVLSSWAQVPHARCAAAARDFWNAQVAGATRFELGDPEVEHALDASLVELLSCRERRGPMWVPVGGPFHYRDVWLRDGARAVYALSVMGRTVEARALARGLILLRWPEGAFVSQRGQLDGTGQALWAFDQALLRPEPDPDPGTVADASLAAWRWCEWERAEGRPLGWPYGAMMPFGEPRDNELTRAQLVGNDAWTIAGYASAERLLRAAGRASEADSVAASRARYLDEFRAALARTRSPDVPPSWQGPGRDWGNLTASFPCGVLAPDDPRMERLARRVWAAAGGPGLLTYGPRDTLHTYLGTDIAVWALLAGERDAADAMLDALLHWRNASGAAAELFSRGTRDFGGNLPPHPTAAAALVTVIRNALVCDEGDTLRLTLGARARWWEGARVQGAPTRWGTLDLSFGRDGDEAHWTWTPVPVWTALTLPPGAQLAGPPPAPLVAGPRGTVLAPPGTGSARLRL